MADDARAAPAARAPRGTTSGSWTPPSSSATALDRGRAPHTIPLEGDLLQNVLDAYTKSSSMASSTTRETCSEERFRLRVRLAMTDRKLAQADWRSHVSRRRGGMVAVLRAGIERGVLRPTSTSAPASTWSTASTPTSSWCVA